MIKFYTNQELSSKLGINLAKWKRWSREFLPPDPLGGLQSGYARQYNTDQAFTVYLGGYLVGDLKFTIPEARHILLDLSDWLADHHFYSNLSRGGLPKNESSQLIEDYQIAVCRSADTQMGDSGFFYVTKGVIADKLEDNGGLSVRQQQFVESTIKIDHKAASLQATAGYRVLNISVLRKKFLNSLNKG